MSTIEAPPQGVDGLSPRGQSVLAVIRSFAGQWVAPRQVRELLDAQDDPISGQHLRKHTTALLERGLIEATGRNADRRFRDPGGSGGGASWGGAEIAMPIARPKTAAAIVNEKVVRRRILHELCYPARRASHDAEGLALSLGIDRDVAAAVVAALLDERLIVCTDGGRFAVKS